MEMNLFLERYAAFKDREFIVVPCEGNDCTANQRITKEAAIRKMERHKGLFLCRSCCLPMSSRTRIGKATSYLRSDATKKKMSDAKIAFYKSEQGIAARKNLSRIAADGHSKNKFENAKRQGWYLSAKANKEVFYGSSYELLLAVQLDVDDEVKTFETQVLYQSIDGKRHRCLDFLITLVDGSKTAIEVKPETRLNEQANIDQIEDARNYANSNNWKFEVCTERTLGMTYQQIRVWADEFRSKQGEFDWVAFRQERNRIKAMKHYKEKISQDKVEVWCDYCQETHYPLRVTHDKNIERNGVYICERKGGSIAGKRPKTERTNPYAAEGKKKCNGPCGEIKLYVEFGADKSRVDGRASRCKICRAASANEKYKMRQKSPDV